MERGLSGVLNPSCEIIELFLCPCFSQCLDLVIAAFMSVGVWIFR